MLRSQGVKHLEHARDGYTPVRAIAKSPARIQENAQVLTSTSSSDTGHTIRLINAAIHLRSNSAPTPAAIPAIAATAVSASIGSVQCGGPPPPLHPGCARTNASASTQVTAVRISAAPASQRASSSIFERLASPAVPM